LTEHHVTGSRSRAETLELFSHLSQHTRALPWSSAFLKCFER
jgi:hypothetical protein